MTNPTYGSDDLRAIADMIEGFQRIFFKDGDYVVEGDSEYGFDYRDISIYHNGKKVGMAVFEDGWIGFQHD